MNKIGWVTFALLSMALPATATELRCGWLKNPTPANWWLTDRDATWTIGLQGGYQAQGIENIPDFGEEYVRTNNSYGYGCACLEVITANERDRIVRIESGEALELSVCRTDPDLPPIH